ncbi:hypothetical protein B0H13DRAFT_1125044 [Mycena leptocephala]|nr:hypothetical protein B0H13DRAFT_1125044 [Mycena leptocephala]
MLPLFFHHLFLLACVSPKSTLTLLFAALPNTRPLPSPRPRSYPASASARPPPTAQPLPPIPPPPSTTLPLRTAPPAAAQRLRLTPGHAESAIGEREPEVAFFAPAVARRTPRT